MKILIKTDSRTRQELRHQRFAWIPRNEIAVSSELSADRDALMNEWDHLEPDTYLRDDASFRFRRFGYFDLHPPSGKVRRLPDGSYYQSREINSYAGGIERHFAPLPDSAADNQFLKELIRFDFAQLPIDDDRAREIWRVDVHFFRVVGRADEAGEPSPEGIHRDGEEFGAIHLIQRRNVAGGVNTVYDIDGQLLASLTLQDPLDSLILWDAHTLHAVSPIRPEVADKPAIRDTLIMGFDHAPGDSDQT